MTPRNPARKKLHGVLDGGGFVRNERGLEFQRRIVGLAHWCPGCKKIHVLHKGEYQFTGTPDKPTVRPACLFPIILDPGSGFRKQEYHCVYVITDGQIYFGLECTHDLAGQIVDLPEWAISDARTLPELPGEFTA